MLIGYNRKKLKKLEVETPKEWSRFLMVGLLKVVRKLCYANYITKGHVDMRSRRNIQTKVSLTSTFVLTALQTQVENTITLNMHV